jgi:hypothetical protein
VFSCSKIEQKQLNTWVSFQSAEQPLLGQFSVSGNTFHPGRVLWYGMLGRSLASFLPCGQAQIWGVISRMNGALPKVRVGFCWKTVKSYWMASNGCIALRSIFWINWLSLMLKGSQGSGLKLVMASAGGSCLRSSPMHTSALTTRWHYAKRMIFAQWV